MIAKKFGNKKAAPFKKGGGRSKNSKNNHKGQPRKGRGGK